ncbi:hypothetical protein TRFO_18959 [Tritrichomonas foetus]|uniref:Uncharacterized protein n=1 Tax=Tritrichomonas foetus TaxID=1144522 RepID=A0A1J4KQ11_9EUKA|nr:hypothetical protein TRFO_18959 [Tritrichomonas foetus]|eukprot:OHT11517.1 hypothetical protein TRFO_18959 [Tritrichomonas foetus]
MNHDHQSLSIRHTMRNLDLHNVGPSAGVENKPKKKSIVKSSPYFKDPIIMADFVGYKSPTYSRLPTSNQQSRSKNNQDEITLDSSISRKKAKSPRRYLPISTGIPYTERTDIIEEKKNEYYNSLHKKYLITNTPYTFDYIATMNKSIDNIKKRNLERNIIEIEKRGKEIEEHELAVKISKHSQIFHNDEIINPRNKFFRIIPTHDRLSSNYDPSVFI